MVEKKDLPPAPDDAGVSDEHFDISAKYIESVIAENVALSAERAEMWSDDWPDPLEMVIHGIAEGHRIDTNYFIGSIDIPPQSLADMLKRELTGCRVENAAEHEKKTWDALVHSFEKAKIAARIENALRARQK